MLLSTVFSGLAAAVCCGQVIYDGKIVVFADKVNNTVSRLTTGACLEDVNHEVYGGIYSQMIFGERFDEPSPAIPIGGFWPGSVWSY